MSPERIGTIGSTHGVNESTSPPRKKIPSTAQRLPWVMTDSIESCSETNAAPPPLDEAVGGDAPAAFAAAPFDEAPLEPAPATGPPAGRFTFSVLVIGG